MLNVSDWDLPHESENAPGQQNCPNCSTQIYQPKTVPSGNNDSLVKGMSTLRFNCIYYRSHKAFLIFRYIGLIISTVLMELLVYGQ